MSPIRSRAAIRFIVALFLAQTFVNAVAVPHPHIHKVLDPRQVVSLPFVERQEPAEPESKNVFDAIIDTLKSYNGWQVFQDFFRKLFSDNPPPSENDDGNNEPSVTGSPTPGASETPADVISVIASIISEVANATEPVVIIPTPTDAPESSTTDEIMSILPIFPITTAIELFPTGEQSVPTELISEPVPETTEAPESTDLPIIVIVPPFEANSTDVGIVLPTGVLSPVGTAPIVTGPVVIAPSSTEIPLFPIGNGTIAAPLPGTDVPVVVIIPTGISNPIDANASASAEVNATISLTSTIGVTVTIEPTLIGTDVPSVGTGLPITLSEAGPYANATAITPTLVLITGTGDAVGTIAPTIAVDPISAPYANTSDAATAVAPIGTGVIIIGTAVLPPLGTAVTSIEPVETIILGTGILGTGTGDATAVAPVETALPLFPNTTTVEIVVEPTFVLGTGTAPAVGTISAAPVASEASDAIYVNTTTTTITNIVTPSLVLGTGVETAVAPAGTIVVVPGPDSTDALFPNITITVNASSDATLSVALPLVTLPVETTEVPVIPVDITSLAPIAPVETEFPAIPIETVTAVGPIIEPIPSDAPVVEFPGEPIIPTLPIVEAPASVEPTPIVVAPIVPIESVEPIVEPTTTLIAPVPALTLDAIPTVETPASVEVPVVATPVVPVVPVVAPVASDATASSIEVPAVATPVVPVVPVVEPVAPVATVPVVPVVAPVAPVPTTFPVAPIPPRIPTFPIRPFTLPGRPAGAPALPAVVPSIIPGRPASRFPPQ